MTLRPLRRCSSGTLTRWNQRGVVVAFVALPLAPAPTLAQPDVPVAPAPHHIVVARDTVWFIPAAPDESADRTRRALGYSVASRSWFETRVRPDHVDPARLALPDGAAEYSASVTASATDGEGFWFGLGSATKHGRLGGGILYAEATNRGVRMMPRPELAENDVSALALVGDAVWVGTSRGTPGVHGMGGLLRFKRSDSSWTQFTSTSSPLPGNDIADLRAFGEQLAIVTDSGAAVHDPRTGSWDGRFFSEIVRNDSLVWTSSMARPVSDSLLIATRRLADLLGETRLSALTAAAHAVNADTVLGVVRVDGAKASDVRRRATIALSNAAFLPFLTRAMGGDDTARRLLASAALVRLKDPSGRQLVREIMDTATIERALALAGPLALQHDPLAIRWLHAKLSDPRVRADTVARSLGGSTPMSRLDTLVATIVHVGDESFVPQLLTLIDVPPPRRILLGVMQLGPLAYQRQLATLVGPRTRLWATYFDLFVTTEHGDAAAPGAPFGEDREIRRSLVTFARVALTRSDSVLAAEGVQSNAARSRLRNSAIAVLAEWGSAPALPFLIEQLERPQLDAVQLLQAIVRLAGRDGGPVFKRSDATPAQRLAARRYWTRWWEANNVSYAPATRAVSESAVLAWRQRAGVH